MYIYTETDSAITRHRPILVDMPNVATMVKLDVSHSMACDSQPPCWFPFFWRLERALPDQTSEDSNWSFRLSRCLKKWPWIQRTFLQVIEWWHVAAEGASCSWWNRLFFEWFWGHTAAAKNIHCSRDRHCCFSHCCFMLPFFEHVQKQRSGIWVSVKTMDPAVHQWQNRSSTLRSIAVVTQSFGGEMTGDSGCSASKNEPPERPEHMSTKIATRGVHHMMSSLQTWCP